MRVLSIIGFTLISVAVAAPLSPAHVQLHKSVDIAELDNFPGQQQAVPSLVLDKRGGDGEKDQWFQVPGVVQDSDEEDLISKLETKPSKTSSDTSSNFYAELETKLKLLRENPADIVAQAEEAQKKLKNLYPDLHITLEGLIDAF